MSKHIAYVKSYDGQTKWMNFLTEDNELLEKYNTVWDNVSTDIKENLIASLSITKIFRKPKKYIIMMKLQIFSIKNCKVGL